MYKEELLKTITNIGHPRVLVVGDFLLDSYVYGDALRISPESPVQVLKVVDRTYCCGGAASVAADIAALEAEPICIGVIGNDANGRELTRQLIEMGADTGGLIELHDRPTISKQRVIGLAQHKHRQQLLRIDEECTDPLEESVYSALLEKFKEKLESAEVVCLQDYNKAVLSEFMCREMIKLAKQAGKKVLVDPAMGGDFTKYSGATLITPNRDETSTAVGFRVVTIDDAAKAAEKLTNDLELEAVVVTLDKEGAYLHCNSVSKHIPTIARTVYDVSGAGDMVLAMTAVSLAAASSFEMAVQLANIAGGIEVQKFGTATVSIDEIINELTGKIRPLDKLIKEIAIKRQQDQNIKIVFTNGCFDVLHRGHVEYLKFCKQQGDIVVLGLNSDSSVKAIKGPDRPINNQHDRAAVLAGLESVDYITIFDTPDPLELITKISPDVLVKGSDWADKGVIGREFVEENGGKVVLAPLVDGKSSTSTIEKIQLLNNKKEDQ